MLLIFRSVLAVALVTPLVAQAGNEVVFVGTSMGGTADPHYFVWSGTGAVSGPHLSSYTDNVNDAAWSDQGRNLFVSQTLMHRISHATWNGTSASWSTFWQGRGPCFGVGLDVPRKLLWTMSGPPGSGSHINYQLYCIDNDPASATYGTTLGQTTTLGGYRERWELSPVGNLAIVPDALLGIIQLIDTDPASPTFLQSIAWKAVQPGVTFAIGTDCAISIDEQYAYVVFSGVASGQTLGGGMAVLHIPTMSWLDFDPAPGQQHFPMPLPTPNRMDLAIDRSFAVVGCGGASATGIPGGVVRIDFDYVNPTLSSSMQYVPAAGMANAPSVSPISDRVVSSLPGWAVIVDANTGALLHNASLPGSANIYTTAWQDSSPTATYLGFGSGCPGTLGTPTLLAAAGSRPALGSTFTARIGNLPNNVALLTMGFSDQWSGGQPLPFDLGLYGMPGCWQLVDPMATVFLAGGGNVATWSWNVPASQSFFGTRFYQQAFVLDGPANGLGLTVSNGGAGMLGF